ncbi:MAG TPA: MFS transporter [Marmoricola sp.]|nr:MFS transporter [Marmoricola sp.]
MHQLCADRRTGTVRFFAGVRGAKVQLSLAALAVAFAAADTYVVVLALPSMMATVGVSLDQVQRGAPIVSAFLLGYVAILPLIGRISDLRGRRPVLVASLVIFSFGSLVTALSSHLGVLVAGRFLQGVGAGGLVPATLALVADLYPVERRSVPLGVVSAVQEIGSVIGPLFGAIILAVSDWETIFWVNLGVGLVLAVALRATGEGPRNSARPWPDFLGGALTVLAVAGLVLTLKQPPSLVDDVVLGWPFVPLTGTSIWMAPLTLASLGFALLALLRFVFAKRPLIDVRGWTRSAVRADLIGALILGVALAGVIFAFAAADPEKSNLSGNTGWWLGGSAIAFVCFMIWMRTAKDPLIPRGALGRRPAWASLLANFFIGSALIASLVEIPTFARFTQYPDSQLGASMVLLRLLVAIPIGAVLGGMLTKRLSTGTVTAFAMAAVAVANVMFSRWDAHSLASVWVTLPLLLGGFGFGLALAPLNSALLAATDAAVHGLASAFAVVTRMIGMLVGVSVLTEIGLHHFYSASAHVTPDKVCPPGVIDCPAYIDQIQGAMIGQMSSIFTGAAVCALIAGLIALIGSTHTSPLHSRTA